MVNSPGLHQIAAGFIPSMGALTAGGCIGWINIENNRKKLMHEGESSGQFDLEFITFFLVVAIAAFLSQFVIQWRGPLFVLKIGAFFTCIGWLIALGLSAYSSPFYTTIYIFALICGFSTGSVPLYVGAIAHIKLRGAIASFLSLNLKMGFLIVDLMLHFHEVRLLSSMAAMLFVCQLFLLFQIREAPIFLILNKQTEEAYEALDWLNGKEDAEKNSKMAEVELNAKKIVDMNYVSMLSECLAHWRVWCIVLGLILFHQLTGHTVAILLAHFIFENAIGMLPSYVLGLVTNLVQLAMIVMSLYLVDRVGRRPLLMSSSIGVAIAALALATSLITQRGRFLAPVALLIYLGMFAFGLETVPWIMIAEMFPYEIKNIACPIAVAMFWLSKILLECVIQIFNYLQIVESDIRFGFLFFFFAAMMLLSLVFVLFFVPETKGKTFEEIKQMLRIKS